MNKIKPFLSTLDFHRYNLLVVILTRLIQAETPLEFNEIWPWHSKVTRKYLLNRLEDMDLIIMYRQPNGRYLYEFNKQPQDNKESF